MSEDTKTKKSMQKESVLQYVKDVMERVKYGRIIIELRDNSNKIDVVTENRTRFSGEKIV